MNKSNKINRWKKNFNLSANTLPREFRLSVENKTGNIFFLLIIALMSWLGATSQVSAQTALLSSNTPAAFSLVHGSYGSGSIVSVTGEPFTQAWQVNVTTSAPSSQSVTLTTTTIANVAKGDTIIASFYYRRTDTTASELNVTACFQQLAAPVTDAVVLPLRGREQWRQISIPFIANADYTAGTALFYFALSAQIQTVQISGVTLMDYGQKSVFGTGITDASSHFTFSGSAGTTTYATCTSVPVTGNPFFTTASHIAVTNVPPCTPDSYVNLTAFIPVPVTAGDTMIAIFWVRDADSPSIMSVDGVMAQQSGPHVTLFNPSPLIVDGTWKQHIIPFTAPTTYAANGMQILVKCGAQVQTVEFGGLQLLDLGSTVTLASLSSTVNDYPGRLLTDSWRADADARIAQYRKGNFVITATDGSGSPITGLNVTATMKKHLFGFGSAIRAQEVTTATGSDATTYRANVTALFNKVVFENDMKWLNWETTNDPKTVQNAVSWLWTNGIFDIRGHNLVWPSWTNSPTDLPGLSVSALTSRVLTHIDSETEYFKIKNYMSDWDVVNEPYTNHNIMDKLNGITSGRGTVAQDAAVIKTWYTEATADDAYPYSFLNDAGIVENATRLSNAREEYNYSLLSDLIGNGTPIDGFGFESHFTAPTPPLTAKAIFDRFAALGLKEEVTEYDQVTSDSNLQADYLADYMTMVFSEPNFDSFLMWGFWDTQSWIHNAPLYTATWTLKPSGEAWQGLVFGKWWTNTTGTTNSSGAATVNGFLGRYALTASNAGITKVYYTDLPSPAGAALNLKLAGSAGTTHVWLHEADQSVLYSPFTVSADPNAYDGYCVTSAAGSGNSSSPTSGLLRINTEATGTVNLWLRVIAPSSTSDAFWLSIDGSAWQNFAVTQGTSWHWVLWGQTTLAAGTTHSIIIADADGGTELDQVLITDDLAFTP